MSMRSLHTVVIAIVCMALTLKAEVFELESFGSYDFQNRQLSKDYVYNNPNDTYSPSTYVKYGHMISGEDFDTTMAYFQRAAYGAVGLFALGLISLFLLDCGLLWRCCCKCCKCLTPLDDPKYVRKRTCNYVWFYVLCFLVLLFDMLVFYGNTFITGGVNTTKDSVLGLRQLMVNIHDDGIAISDSGTEVYNSLVSIEQNCQNADFDDLLNAVNSSTKALKSLAKSTTSLTDAMLNVVDYINLYAINYRMMGMYILWGLSILSVILLLLAHFCKARVSLQLSMFFSQFTYVIYLLLGVLWCILYTVLSDFCMQPTGTLLRIAPSGTAEDMINYFATCQGSSVLNDYVNKSVSSLHQAVNNLNSTAQYCPSESASFDSARDSLNDMIDSFGDIYDNLRCQNIQTIWLDFFNNGLCTDFHTGMFFIWGSQLITSFLIFLVVLTAAYMHQYYKKDHTVVPTHDDDHNAVDQDPRHGGPPQHAQAIVHDEYGKPDKQQNGYHQVSHHTSNTNTNMSPMEVQGNDDDFFV